MPTLTYAEKLKDPRWQRKRLEVFNHAEFHCQLCGEDKKTLHVHHSRYDGREPWEYPLGWLICLCEDCHSQHHRNGRSKTNPSTVTDESPRLKINEAVRQICRLALLNKECREWAKAQPQLPANALGEGAELLRKILSYPVHDIVSVFETLNPIEQTTAVWLLEEKRIPADPLQMMKDQWNGIFTAWFLQTPSLSTFESIEQIYAEPNTSNK